MQNNSYANMISDICALTYCTASCTRRTHCQAVAKFSSDQAPETDVLHSGISSLLCYAPPECPHEDSCIRIAQFARDKLRMSYAIHEFNRSDLPHTIEMGA